MTALAISCIVLGSFVTACSYKLLRLRFQRKGHRYPSLLSGVCVLVAILTMIGWVISAQRRETDPPPSPLVMIVFAISGLTTLVSYGYLVARSYKLFRNTVRRKGYNSPAVLTTFGLSCAIFVIAGTLASARYLQDAFPVLMVFIIVALLVAALFASALHPKNRRAGGPRFVRFPYRKAGYALIGLGIATPFAAWFTGRDKMSRLIQFAFGLFSMAASSLAIARRATAPAADGVMTEDSRRPVLFLRPFSQDEQVFAEAEGILHVPFSSALPFFARYRNRTLEQYLAEEIRRQIGPFIALGNPEDFVAPEGAARLYVGDARWKEQFCELSRRAAVILVVVGVSEHPAWELRYLKEAGYVRKLFVLTKPWLRKRWVASKREARERQMTWAAFLSALREIGYRSDNQDPGSGSVISFDTDARAVPLCSNAKSPGEMLRPIVASLSSSQPSSN